MSDLARLIDVINVKLARVAAADHHDYEDFKRWASEGAAVLQEMRDEHGARIRLDREPATMRLAGISTSATGGWNALLNNWVHAARKKLGEA